MTCVVTMLNPVPSGDGAEFRSSSAYSDGQVHDVTTNPLGDNQAYIVATGKAECGDCGVAEVEYRAAGWWFFWEFLRKEIACSVCV